MGQSKQRKKAAPPQRPEKATLTLYPTPSPLQQKAFDLLRLNPAL